MTRLHVTINGAEGDSQLVVIAEPGWTIQQAREGREARGREIFPGTRNRGSPGFSLQYRDYYYRLERLSGVGIYFLLYGIARVRTRTGITLPPPSLTGRDQKSRGSTQRLREHARIFIVDEWGVACSSGALTTAASSSRV